MYSWILNVFYSDVKWKITPENRWKPNQLHNIICDGYIWIRKVHQTWYAVAEYTRLSLVELKDLLRHTKQNHAHDKSNQPTKGNSREFISGARTNFRKLYLWAQITETEFNKRVLLLRFRCWGRKSLQLNLPKEQKKKAPRKKKGAMRWVDLPKSTLPRWTKKCYAHSSVCSMILIRFILHVRVRRAF